jgi:hypothetical protein
MAENIPAGTAINNVMAVMVNVLMIAGIMETLVVLYSHANSSGFRLGMPFAKMYRSRAASTASVMTAESTTITARNKEKGLLLYDFSLSEKDCLLIYSISQPSFTAWKNKD